MDEDSLQKEIARALREISDTLGKIFLEMKESPRPSLPSHRRREGVLKWLIYNRFIIYVVGLIFWWGLSIYLPTFSLASWASLGAEGFRSPLLIGYVLLLINLVSERLPRGEIPNPDPFDNKIYEFERARVQLIQDYGGTVIVAASVVAAIVGVQTTITAQAKELFFAYLAHRLRLGRSHSYQYGSRRSTGVRCRSSGTRRPSCLLGRWPGWLRQSNSYCPARHPSEHKDLLVGSAFPNCRLCNHDEKGVAWGLPREPSHAGFCALRSAETNQPLT